jgi:serine protease AprX
VKTSAPEDRHRRSRTLVAILTGASALLVGSVTVLVPAGGGVASASSSSDAKSPQLGGGDVTASSVRWGDKQWGDSLTDFNAKSITGKNDAAKDAGSLATITTVIGARQVWATKDASGKAITGQGVTVALLDTGIASVSGLNGVGKVMAGPDLSLEANSPTLSGGDNFGHGTHMAGIIAARDAVTVDATTGQPKPADASVQLGVAPDARVLSVKLGTRDGSTDVSQVIAGLDWVVQHRNDNGMRIRVLNLSFGTESTQSYLIDPLAAAVENAWQHGIVVVVSGGNDGITAKALTNPAIDPFVIAVGASDPMDLVAGWKVPQVASFSSHGTLARHVDLLAPGTSIASLRAPGSFIDANHP